VNTTASFASRVFAVPSSCFPAPPATTSLRIGTPVPSMERCRHDSNGVPSMTSGRSQRAAAAPSSSGKRGRERDEASTPA